MFNWQINYFQCISNNPNNKGIKLDMSPKRMSSCWNVMLEEKLEFITETLQGHLEMYLKLFMFQLNKILLYSAVLGRNIFFNWHMIYCKCTCNQGSVWVVGWLFVSNTEVKQTNNQASKKATNQPNNNIHVTDNFPMFFCLVYRALSWTKYKQ